MHIHDRVDVLADRCAKRRTKGQVRHEMPVHHVDVDPIRALRLNGFDFRAKIGEISG